MFIGAEARQAEQRFKAFYPAEAAHSDLDYSEASTEHIAENCALAKVAFPIFSTTSSVERAAFLEAIADEIEQIGDMLIETAIRETGLPRARLESERGRTTGQLRLFTEEVRADLWRDIVIDPAHPGTGELVARAIASAVAAKNIPSETFSFFPGTSRAVFEGNNTASDISAEESLRSFGGFFFWVWRV